jgi:hypothetical protein
LLGLVREGDGVAAQVLVSLSADLGQVRVRVIEMMSGYKGDDADVVHMQAVSDLNRLRSPTDSLLLRLLWTSNMIREPQNDAEQSIWEEVKDRLEPGSEGGSAAP